MTSKVPLRVLTIDAEGLLRVPDWVPASVAKLADDLYTYAATPESTPLYGADTPEEQARAVTTWIVPSLLDISGPEPSGPSSWSDLVKMEFGALSGRITDLTDEWILDAQADAQRSQIFPPRVIAVYGLVRLDESLSSTVDANARLNGACVAGRCLGVAAFLTGLDQGNREATRETTVSAANTRWAPLNEIRADVRDRYRDGRWGSKAQFIRAVQDDVIATAESKSIRLAPTNVQSLIRKWLQGL